MIMTVNLLPEVIDSSRRFYVRNGDLKDTLSQTAMASEFISGKHKVADNNEEAVVQSVNAGLNVRTNFSSPAGFIKPLRSAIAKGKVSQATIDQRVSEILYVKFWLGLFDNPYRGDGKLADKIVHCKEHQAVALEAAVSQLFF